MPAGPYLGALGGGLGPGYDKGYESSLDQMSSVAAGQGLQLLQALAMQPPQPPPMQPQGMQPQGGMQPPMGGGQPPNMPPPMGGGPQLTQGSPPMGGPPGGGMAQPPMQGPMGGPPMGPQGGAQPGMQPPMQGGGQPGGQQQGGGLDWRTLIMAVQRGNPGAPPQVLMAAVNKLVPLMNSQSMLEWRHMQAQTAQDRVGVTARGQDIRADTAERGQDVRAETAAGAQDVAKRGQDVRAATAEKAQQGVQDRFNIREARITAHQMVQADQAWQRLDQQRKQAEARGDVTVKRAALDALHKRTMEVISAWSTNSQMPPETRRQLLKDADEAYNNQIRALGKGDKASFGERFQGGGESSP